MHAMISQRLNIMAGEDKATCPKCRSKISKEKIFPVQLFEPSSEEVSKITGVKAESHDDYHQAIAQVVQKVKQGNGDDEADRKEEQMKRMVKKEAIPESDMDESDVDELASSPPKRKPNRARSKARKTRIVKSVGDDRHQGVTCPDICTQDDEDEEDDRHTSDDDFIDDSGVNGSLQQKTSKKKMAGDKGKGKARATESDIDEYTDDDSETEDDEPSLMSRRGVRVVNKIESKAAKALLDKRSQVLPSTKVRQATWHLLTIANFVADDAYVAGSFRRPTRRQVPHYLAGEFASSAEYTARSVLSLNSPNCSGRPCCLLCLHI